MNIDFTPKFFLTFLLSFQFLSVVNLTKAQNQEPETLAIRQIEENDSPTIDGILNETIWQQSANTSKFIQREPNEGSEVSEKTIVYICYDKENIYFGFSCSDSNASEIIATEMRRDEYLQNNDFIEIYLDTYHDHRSAFYFATNPLGAKRDGIVVSELPGMNQNWDWNGVWEVATDWDNTGGWTAEIAIPFKTLRFTSADIMTWGLNMARYIPRKREEAFWAPISREYGYWGKYNISIFGHLEGLANIQQPTKLELKPFALTGLGKDFTESTDYTRKLQVGLDARYLLTPNLTATLTYNTDFAQVEADQEQVNLSRFELFLPEKREFFLEGANTFNFEERAYNFLSQPNKLFFSRRIGLSEDNEMIPLIGGIKLTGKEGPFNIGFLNIVSDDIQYYNDDDEYINIPKTNYSVLRIQQDIFTNSSIGIIGLNKQSLEGIGYARNFGVDANFYLTKNTQVGGFLASSHEPLITKNNYAGYADIYHTDDLFTLFASQNSIQENFNAEMGFFPRTGIRTTQLNTGISPRPEILNIRQLFLFNNFNYVTDQNSLLESRTNLTGFFSLFKNGSYLFGAYVQNYERLTEEFEIHDDVIIPESIYRFDYYMLEYQTDRSKPFAGSLLYGDGDFFNGSLRSFVFKGYLKAGGHLTMELMVDYNDAQLATGNFNTTLVGARIVYSFTPYLFIKPYIQWNSDTQKVISNVLLNFIHRPGSDLFVVYNEEFDVSQPSPVTENRTILVKMTYLFNL